MNYSAQFFSPEDPQSQIRSSYDHPRDYWLQQLEYREQSAEGQFDEPFQHDGAEEGYIELGDELQIEQSEQNNNQGQNYEIQTNPRMQRIQQPHPYCQHFSQKFDSSDMMYNQMNDTETAYQLNNSHQFLNCKFQQQKNEGQNDPFLQQKMKQLLKRKKICIRMRELRMQRRLGLIEGPTRKKRIVITPQLLEQLKIFFADYNNRLEKPSKQRLTFKEISARINISMSEINHLYDQYTKDPLFMSRMSRCRQRSKKIRGSCGNHHLTNERLKFLEKLIKTNCSLTQTEIAKEMSKVDSLHQYTRQGEKLPISRKIVQHLMKVGNLNRKKAQANHRNSNTPEDIANRFRYCCRYLQLTDDKQSDIYFLGECYFSSNLAGSVYSRSLSERTGGKQTKNYQQLKESQEKMSRNIQFIGVIGLSGLIYYQIYQNISEQINFWKTVMQIGRVISNRSPNQNKYLILEFSPFHKLEDLHHMQQEYGVKVIFVPPITPMIQPIEYWFNQVKHLVKTRSYKYKRGYRFILAELLEQYKNKNMAHYFNCIKPYVQLALKKQPFK